jgi:hypothetical protein
MKIKNGIGAKKPTDILELSAIQPISGGKIAPPTIAITIKEDAFFVLGPRSLIPNANMVGNMIDIKKNTPYKPISDPHPSPALTTGNSKQHMAAYMASILVGWKNRIR